MQDNTKRANRVLFWIKVIFVLFVFLWLQFVLDFICAYLIAHTFVTQYAVLFVGAFHMICFFGVGVAMFVAIFAFCVSFLSWLHRAVSNLRLLTTTSFSPMGAVLLTCIPFVGYFLHYLIFSDMVKSQEKYMQQKGILKERFPKRILNAWIIVSLVLIAIILARPDETGIFTALFMTFEFNGSDAIEFLEKTLIAAIPILYIMSFSAYIKQERELFRIHTEELFNKHVDEVIREREIMRAAEMLRKSQETENPQAPQDLHSK